MVPLVLGNPHILIDFRGHRFCGLPGNCVVEAGFIWQEYGLLSKLLKGGYIGDYIGDYYRGYYGGN